MEETEGNGEMAAPQNTFIVTSQRLSLKIMMVSSDLPSLKHCIVHLTHLCHGAYLHC